jgi:hypothetical protein
MAYTIYKSDGTAVTIADNSFNDTFYDSTANGTGKGLGTQLIGRNSKNWGAATAQNILQLRENFCGTVMPSDSTAPQGQLWFNKLSNTSGDLYVRSTNTTSGGMANWTKLLTSNTFSSTTGSSQVGFIQDGIGSQPRTVQSKLRDFVNVKDFGAVGNGIASDSAAIQAAINAVNATGGGTVYIPEGTYNLQTTGLIVYQNIKLCGDVNSYVAGTRGTLLNYGGTGRVISGQNLLNVTIEDISIDATASTGTAVIGIYFNGAWLSTVRRVRIKGVTRVKGYGILVDNNDNAFGPGTDPWGSQHNLFEMIECADGVIRMAGTGASEGITTTVMNTIRGMQYEFQNFQGALINTTAESWDQGSGFSFDGLGTDVTMVSCDIELAWKGPWQMVVGQQYEIAQLGSGGGAITWASYGTGFTPPGPVVGSVFTCTAVGPTDPVGVPNPDLPRVRLNTPAIAIGTVSGTPDSGVREIGTIWLGYNAPNKVSGNMATLRSYGGALQYINEQLTANTPYKVAGWQDRNAVYLEDYIYPTNTAGGAQAAYRYWTRNVGGAMTVDHNWRQHAFVEKAISTSSTSATTIFTIPVPNGQGLRLSAHACGIQTGDDYYSNYRECVVVNKAGTLAVTAQTQQTVGAPCAISFTISGQNILVQWTPTTVNASTGNMNLEIRGPWTSYS